MAEIKQSVLNALSTSDLKALADGNLDAVSTTALKLLADVEFGAGESFARGADASRPVGQLRAADRRLGGYARSLPCRSGRGEQGDASQGRSSGSGPAPNDRQQPIAQAGHSSRMGSRRHPRNPSLYRYRVAGHCDGSEGWAGRPCF